MTSAPTVRERRNSVIKQMKPTTNDRIIAAAWVLLILAAALVVLTGFSEKVPEREERTILVIEGGPHEEAYEDPDEAEKSAEAVIAAIGTDREFETFGYDVTKVLQIVTAEAGNDADQCRGIVQALFNACNRHRNRCTPEEVCREYQYTTPASWVSDAARNAFCEVFVYGETFTDIGNATVFYNPQIAGHSEYHEGQIYVCSIGDVKYFEEV